jgi:ATP-binding cassette subfamily F protein 3
MLLQPANFLLLDEPTNHLDMRAKDVLLEALTKYMGTVVFVSHDRYFIDKLATRVFEIGDGKVEIYPGNYEDYIWRKQGGANQQDAEIRRDLPSEDRVVFATGNQSATKIEPSNGNPPAIQATDAKSRRLNPIKRKQLEDRLAEIEEEITRMEAAIAVSETALQTFVSPEETQRQTRELAMRKNDLQRLMDEWERLSEALT